MKVCENCGTEIYTKDGEGLCDACERAEDLSQAKLKARRKRANAVRREREAVMRDCGLVKVRGALGGTYWE